MPAPLHPLPEYGPLEIENLQQFLTESKAHVSKLNESKSNGIKADLDFNTLTYVQTIGIGSFGTVLLMTDGEDNQYAVKAIEKFKIVKTKQVNHILNEKKILSVMNFPFIVHLIQFYSDNSYIYFVLPFISGGDMFSLLRKFKKFEEGQSRFYAAQIALALEYLHFNDLIYRDLKPENILMDHTGYVKITDFGFGKHLKNRTWTLCGTPEYLAPEVVLNKGYSKAVDWWAFGVLIFEMVAGRSPFFANDPLRIYEKIVASRFICPPSISSECKQIVNGLLQPNISLRLGNLKNGVLDLKEHCWFRPINWMAILNRKMDPPYKPTEVAGGENFGDFKDITLKVSKTERFSKEFDGF